MYRQVNKVFKDDFDHFLSSGCYDHLVKNRWLIPHEEVYENFSRSSDWYKTLRPLRIPFISYPYEWCFDMLKDTALLTLQIAREVLPFGLVLKDATPFNIQWLYGKPVFIDTLSFEKYEPTSPWIAYRQFCECFLSPLLLMSYTNQPLQSLLLTYPEGIPLPITRSLLPWRTRLSFHTYLHVHLHERLAAKGVGKELAQKANFSEKKLLRLFESLKSLIESLDWKDRTTTWSNYYQEANQRKDYVEGKKNIVVGWLNSLPESKTAIDLGANEGEFSFLLSVKNTQAIAVDFDHSALNKLYKKIKQEEVKNILPLLIDLSNPSPSIGLNNNERSSFFQRASVELALALALVHHLAIGKNVPFEKIAELFEKVTTNLIVEFIPKQDDKVQLMLKQKKDIHPGYNEENFLKAFERSFSVLYKKTVPGSDRVLFLMKRKFEGASWG